MRILTIASLGALAFIPFSLPADTLGLYAGVAAWFQDPGGSIQFRGDRLDVEDDLGLDGDTEVFAWLALEHPVPVLPNLRVSITNVSSSGAGAIAQNFTFGGVTFTGGEDIASELDLDQVDLALYYELLDNVVEADLGVNAKYVDGSAKVRSLTDASLNESVSFNGVLPMLYARLGANLPFSGLSAAIEGGGLSYSGNTIADYSVKLSYETPYFIGLEAGYRGQVVDLDDFDDVTSDIDISGAYIGLFGHL